MLIVLTKFMVTDQLKVFISIHGDRFFLLMEETVATVYFINILNLNIAYRFYME